MLHYLVSLADPHGHYIDVQLQFQADTTKLKSGPAGASRIELWLPVWIPGSYLVREFSRNIISLAAKVNTFEALCTKTSKNRWALDIPAELLDQKDLVIQCNWRVYAWDLSVRGAHFDQTHAFFNGTSVFVVPEGMEDIPIEVQLLRPVATGENVAGSEWLVASGLPCEDEGLAPKAGCQYLSQGGSLTYRAENYDMLLDHPFEMGQLLVHEFIACGTPHYLAFYGADENLDLERLAKDLTPVCEEQIRLFEPQSAKAPFEAYWFLVHATDSGYGGLEHRNSTALLCNRDDLPQKGVAKAPAGYDQFMGLCSHEYFHSWNVKRIKPAGFVPYDLSQESYTRLLWVFEGFTSYYDDLILARTGYFDEPAYLKAFGKTIAQVMRGPGRQQQPVAESSFEAWTKYYRQDENAPNAIVSYYTKGALVAFCLDMAIRKATSEQKSLDDVMRQLWVDHGKTGVGVPEGGIASIVKKATGIDLNAEISRWTATTEELPLQAMYDELGCELQADTGNNLCSLGITGQIKSEGMKVRSVINGGPAHQAGISSGDVLVSIGNRKLTQKNLDRFIQSTPANTQTDIIGFRAETLMQFSLLSGQPDTKEWKIVAGEKRRLNRPWSKSQNA